MARTIANAARPANGTAQRGLAVRRGAPRPNRPMPGPRVWRAVHARRSARIERRLRTGRRRLLVRAALVGRPTPASSRSTAPVRPTCGPTGRAAGRLRHRGSASRSSSYCRGDACARRTGAQMMRPASGFRRRQRADEPLGREQPGPLVSDAHVRCRGISEPLHRRRPTPLAAGAARPLRRPPSPPARSARAWRRLSRARVRSARAATWLTPSAAASSSPVRSWSSASRRAARCRSGIRSSARWSSADSRAP